MLKGVVGLPIFRQKMILMKYITVMAAGVLLLSGCKKEKERICDVYAGEHGYAIGVVDSYIKMPLKVTYKYSYSVNGKKYEGKEKVYGIGQLDPTRVGKQYVVVYKASDPEESDLNVNYAVSSPSVLAQYIVEFAVTPPKPDFPRKKCE